MWLRCWSGRALVHMACVEAARRLRRARREPAVLGGGSDGCCSALWQMLALPLWRLVVVQQGPWGCVSRRRRRPPWPYVCGARCHPRSASRPVATRPRAVCCSVAGAQACGAALLSACGCLPSGPSLGPMLEREGSDGVHCWVPATTPAAVVIVHALRRPRRWPARSVSAGVLPVERRWPEATRRVATRSARRRPRVMLVSPPVFRAYTVQQARHRMQPAVGETEGVHRGTEALLHEAIPDVLVKACFLLEEHCSGQGRQH